jgi:hypothetical protein
MVWNEPNRVDVSYLCISYQFPKRCVLYCYFEYERWKKTKNLIILSIRKCYKIRSVYEINGRPKEAFLWKKQQGKTTNVLWSFFKKKSNIKADTMSFFYEEFPAKYLLIFPFNKEITFQGPLLGTDGTIPSVRIFCTYILQCTLVFTVVQSVNILCICTILLCWNVVRSRQTWSMRLSRIPSEFLRHGELEKKNVKPELYVSDPVWQKWHYPYQCGNIYCLWKSKKHTV